MVFLFPYTFARIDPHCLFKSTTNCLADCNTKHLDIGDIALLQKVQCQVVQMAVLLECLISE